MKQNAKIKYVLVTLVLMIWGLVIYKVCAGLFAGEAHIVAPLVKPVVNADTVAPYYLMKDSYPDPFSNDILTKEELPKEEVAVKAATAPIAPQSVSVAESSVPQPVIKYCGYIFNPVTKNKMALITVNGRGVTAGVNEKIDMGIKVLDITALKIVLSYKGKTMIVAMGAS